MPQTTQAPAWKTHPSRMTPAWPACSDCKHRVGSGGSMDLSLCDHPAMPVHPIHGWPETACDLERGRDADNRLCGQSGLLFERLESFHGQR